MTTLQEHDAKLDAFASHPVIKQLAVSDKWTVSTNEKMPVDIYLLEQGNMAGCNVNTPYSTRTLDELRTIIPHAMNYALYFDCSVDLIDNKRVCVLDIEPSCSDELKKTLLCLPALYREKSMSGKGYHLLVELPEDVMEKYPIAASKKVLKDGKHGFEFLFEHWVTFTTNQCPDPDPDTLLDKSTIADVMEKLAKTAKETTFTEFDLATEMPNDIPHRDIILQKCAINANAFLKERTLEYYDMDASRYEFAFINILLRAVRATQALIRRDFDTQATWTDSQTAWLVYLIAIQHLPHREKHDQMRNGMPLLLYSAGNAVSMEPMKEKVKGGIENAE